MNRKNKVNKSQSSSDLYSQLIDVKDRKKVFLKQLKNNINESQKIIKKNHSQSNIEMLAKKQAKILNKKQKSLDQLARSLSDRISIDKLAVKKLQNLTEQQLQKKQQLQKRIQEIKKRNQHRLKQLQQFQNKYLKKLNQQYRKDKQKEQKLLGQYQQVLQQHGKIKQTQSYRKAIEAEDWKAIIKQKQKLQKMILQFRKKQQMLIKDQNPQTLRKIIQQNQANKMIVVTQQEVVQKVRKPRVKVDAKQIGNQYLQYAKKLKQLPKQRPKVRLLDINFKCIDYQEDIMDKIARNTSDLSKYRILQPARVTVQKQKQPKFNKQPPLKQTSSKQAPSKPNNFQLKQSQETKKYLKQIRANLNQLQKTT